MSEILILRDAEWTRASVLPAGDRRTVPKGMVGRVIGPGESCWGRSYAEWAAHVGSAVELPQGARRSPAQIREEAPAAAVSLGSGCLWSAAGMSLVGILRIAFARGDRVLEMAILLLVLAAWESRSRHAAVPVVAALAGCFLVRASALPDITEIVLCSALVLAALVSLYFLVPARGGGTRRGGGRTSQGASGGPAESRDG